MSLNWNSQYEERREIINGPSTVSAHRHSWKNVKKNNSSTQVISTILHSIYCLTAKYPSILNIVRIAENNNHFTKYFATTVGKVCNF